MNESNSQRTGVYSPLSKSQVKSLTNTTLNQPIYPLLPRLQVDSIIEVQLSATEWMWRIRKCGTFACQVLESNVQSAFDIQVDFEGFANLIDPNSNIQINTWYALSQTVPPPPNSNEWISAKLFNLADFLISAPTNGFNWNLWCKIEITGDIKASEYVNTPTITFIAQNFEEWVEPGLANERVGIINKIQPDNR